MYTCDAIAEVLWKRTEGAITSNARFVSWNGAGNVGEQSISTMDAKKLRTTRTKLISYEQRGCSKSHFTSTPHTMSITNGKSAFYHGSLSFINRLESLSTFAKSAAWVYIPLVFVGYATLPTEIRYSPHMRQSYRRWGLGTSAILASCFVVDAYGPPTKQYLQWVTSK